MAAVDVVDAYLRSLPGEARRVAHAEWGITLEPAHTGEWPLDVGVRIADGLLTAKAHALSDAAHVDPWMLLWWNRSTLMVRFAATQGREVWVHADLAVADLDEQQLDRLLGLLVEGAIAVRDFQRAKRRPAAEGASWLGEAARPPSGDL
jgi:hypothetical protein